MKLNELHINVNEDIAADLRRARRLRAQAEAPVWLIRLNKDGSESKMHDAKTHFADEDQALASHHMMVKTNPGKLIQHNLYSRGLAGKVLKVKLVGDEAPK